MNNKIIVGQVVKSKAGRDRDKYYLVAKVMPNQKNVLLVDGEKRLLANPKKKNCYHLQPTNKFSRELADKIETGVTALDKEIRGYLKNINVDQSYRVK